MSRFVIDPFEPCYLALFEIGSDGNDRDGPLAAPVDVTEIAVDFVAHQI